MCVLTIVQNFTAGPDHDGPDVLLAEWLRPAAGQALPGVVAVGLQEMVELKAAELIHGQKSHGGEVLCQRWREELNGLLDRTVGVSNGKSGGGGYVCLATEQLVGLMMVVFVRRELLPFVRAVRHSAASSQHGPIRSREGGRAI